jgi:hypothetical protein
MSNPIKVPLSNFVFPKVPRVEATPKIPKVNIPSIAALQALGNFKAPNIPNVPGIPNTTFKLPSLSLSSVLKLKTSVPALPKINIPQAKNLASLGSLPSTNIPGVSGILGIPKPPSLSFSGVLKLSQQLPKVPKLNIPHVTNLEAAGGFAVPNIPNIPGAPTIPSSITTPSFPKVPNVPNVPSIPIVPPPIPPLPSLTVCATSFIPTFSSLYSQFIPAFNFPPKSITIPPLPALPSPIFPGIDSINLEVVQLVQQLQSFQLLTVLDVLLAPLLAITGQSLSSVLPKIPGTNITLTDLLALNPAPIYAALAALTPSQLSAIPGVPNPLSYTINSPSMQIVNAIQSIMSGYTTMVLDIITSIVNDVTSILHVPGMPVPPTIPSMADIQAAIIPPGLTPAQVKALLSSVSLNDLLARFAIPSPFPPMPLLPDPLTPSFNAPEIDLMAGLNQLYLNMSTYVMKLISDFIQSLLGFAEKLVCITI